jgi:hypothetical protein
MANAPLAGRDGKSYSLILVSEKQKYFCKGGLDKANHQRPADLPDGQIRAADTRPISAVRTLNPDIVLAN